MFSQGKDKRDALFARALEHRSANRQSLFATGDVKTSVLLLDSSWLAGGPSSGRFSAAGVGGASAGPCEFVPSCTSPSSKDISNAVQSRLNK